MPKYHENLIVKHFYIPKIFKVFITNETFAFVKFTKNNLKDFLKDREYFFHSVFINFIKTFMFGKLF